MNHIELLESKEACFDAVEWASNYPNFESAWNACHRGDWMLWVAAELGADKRKLTLAKGRCAETVIHLMKDERSVAAVKASIAYGNGKISEQQLKNAYAAAAAAADDAADAAYAACAAYVAADADADAYAAYVAAYAADAAAAAYAADAADAAAYAADAAAAAYAADAADADAYADARKENQQKTADICREILTEEVFNRLRAT